MSPWRRSRGDHATRRCWPTHLIVRVRFISNAEPQTLIKPMSRIDFEHLKAHRQPLAFGVAPIDRHRPDVVTVNKDDLVVSRGKRGLESLLLVSMQVAWPPSTSHTRRQVAVTRHRIRGDDRAGSDGVISRQVDGTPRIPLQRCICNNGTF